MPEVQISEPSRSPSLRSWLERYESQLAASSSWCLSSFLHIPLHRHLAQAQCPNGPLRPQPCRAVAMSNNLQDSRGKVFTTQSSHFSQRIDENLIVSEEVCYCYRVCSDKQVAHFYKVGQRACWCVSNKDEYDWIANIAVGHP